MQNNNIVIAVTRQFGSLGRPIAMKVAETMGLKFIDREIIEQAGQKMGYHIDELEKIDNQRIKGFDRMKYPLGLGSKETQDKLFELEKSLILEFANYENCVIVGRCANYILRKKPNVMKIHIYAPYEKRLEMSMNDLSLSEKKATSLINKVDEARSNYYLYHTGELFDSTIHRDLLINSSLLSFDDTVKLICDCVKMKYKL